MTRLSTKILVPPTAQVPAEAEFSEGHEYDVETFVVVPNLNLGLETGVLRFETRLHAVIIDNNGRAWGIPTTALTFTKIYSDYKSGEEPAND